MAKWWPVLLLLGIAGVVGLVFLFRRSDGGSDFLPGFFGGQKSSGAGTAACIGASAYFGGGASAIPLCGQLGPALDPLADPAIKHAGSLIDEAGGAAVGFVGGAIDFGGSVLGDLRDISPISWGPKLVKGAVSTAGNVIQKGVSTAKDVVSFLNPFD